MSKLWAAGNGDMRGYFEERHVEGRVLERREQNVLGGPLTRETL